jgi:hypothetical protein
MARAEGDHYVVRRLQADADAPVWVLGFHAQQAVEKALKAVLSGAGRTYPRTHNLVMLAELLHSFAVALPPDAEQFGRLTPFGVALRYDVDFAADSIGMDPAAFAGIVDRTLEWARERLNENKAQVHRASHD